MTTNTTKDFWIFRQNLLPALLIISQIINYDLDDDDFNAIGYGLVGTSDEKNVWWTYQFTGDYMIDLRFACDEEDKEIIFIQLSFDEDLGGQVDLTIFVVQEFNLQYKHLKNGKL
jgi:hypothetical protein